MPRYTLSNTSRTEIERKLDAMFDRLLVRFIGTHATGAKTIGFEILPSDPVLSLSGMFTSSLLESGASSDAAQDVLASVAKIAVNYINGVRERTKAKVLHAVENSVARTDTEAADQVLKELEGQLSSIWISTVADVNRIVETETANARNEAAHEGITRVNLTVGIQDAVVFKVVVHDEVLCKNCRALWLMSDGVTPRLYKMSELRHGYMDDHKHPFPTIGSTHPHCRCTMTTLFPGFGFGPDGLVTYIREGHDEYARQRGMGNV